MSPRKALSLDWSVLFGAKRRSGKLIGALAAVVLLLQPTLATVLGAVILHQRMSAAQTVALVPVVLGLAIATTRSGRRGATLGK